MTFTRFNELLYTLHLVDITSRVENKNRLWKVRGLYNDIKDLLPMETNLFVDEQIITLKGQLT